MHPILKHLQETDKSQAQFAEQLDITKQYLSMILRSERWPGYFLSVKISQITGIDPIVLQGFNRSN
jgi:transcriptional regulator with XRE-family HTH domain